MTLDRVPKTPVSGPAVRSNGRTVLSSRASFLLSALGAYSGRRFAKLLGPLGLHPRHFGLLMLLVGHDGQTQQQLADALGLHRNAMVGLVDELEARGLVKRRHHPDDRRAHAVCLTARARTLLREADRIGDEFEAELVTDLRPDEQQTLIVLLQCVAASAGLTPGLHPSINQLPDPDRRTSSPKRKRP